jgi:hypothetical protein
MLLALARAARLRLDGRCFVAVQQVESNSVQPLLQKRMADVPPVLLLLSWWRRHRVWPRRPSCSPAPLRGGRLVAVAEALRSAQTLGNEAQVPRRENGAPAET